MCPQLRYLVFPTKSKIFFPKSLEKNVFGKTYTTSNLKKEAAASTNFGKHTIS